jgi:hypothetical protein
MPSYKRFDCFKYRDDRAEQDSDFILAQQTAEDNLRFVLNEAVRRTTPKARENWDYKDYAHGWSAILHAELLEYTGPLNRTSLIKMASRLGLLDGYDNPRQFYAAVGELQREDINIYLRAKGLIE